MINTGNDNIARIKRPARRRGVALAAISVLAVAAFVVRSKTRQAERANPPIGQFIEVDGIRLHYLERGQGQALVLLHGNGSMMEDFACSGLLDRAAENYRVIIFDRPGFGHSERPRNKIWTPIAQARLLQRALRQLEVEQAIVVGHSWGTLVALAMALEFPSYVRSLVLLSGYYYPSLRLDAALVAPPAIPVIGDLLRFTVSPLLGRAIWPAAVRRIFSPAAVSPRFAAFPVWMALRPSQLRAAAAESAMMVPSAMALCNRYRELTMPVAILAGAEDRIADAQHNSKRLHDELPQSDLRLTAGAGHMLHYLVPDEVMAAIDAVEEAAGLRQMPAPTRHAGMGRQPSMH
ncbi:MAG: alpha/beta hydrolase [Burkholderiales bacterium RIFCSPLOWO2_02_FULL_57_36]|nr:MAG: alpha/beta hydrolase [Burkholderiales bacterium RIFCSPLOWO2_02_FULL_57_36]